MNITTIAMLIIKQTALAIFMLGAVTGCSEQDQQPLPDDIKLQTQLRIDKKYHLGTVIGVIDKTGMRFYGFGQMSLVNTAQPDENTLFEIGSVTKTFTATLLADLDSKGVVDMQVPIQSYLPVFNKVLKPQDNPISLLNLVTHTSGLPRDPLNMDQEEDDRYKHYSVDDLNSFLENYSLEPRVDAYQYSNLGALVIEHAIEQKTKTSYETLIQDRITRPLNMTDTHFDVPDAKRIRLVTGYKNGAITGELDLGEFQAMGGLRSTAKDMLIFLGAQLGIHSTPLNQAIKMTHRKSYADDEITMGLGWHIQTSKTSGKTIHYHKGSTPGFVSLAAFNLEDQIGVVVLVNGRQWFSDLGFKLLDPTYPLADPQ
jgi:D-alanyl-D-alanine-carboxypeptidase/D-alanyl-D-alanine-endopeptidase